MANRFTYQQRPAENWDQRAEQRGSNYIGFIKDSIDTYSPKKGENWIRVLPPTWQNARHYGYDVFVHYGVGPQNATVLCNLKMFNSRCCICEAYTKADSEGREDAYDFKATKRVLIYLIDRKEETQPLAWAMPWTVDRDMTIQCKDRQTGELYQIDHPEAGYDVSFQKEGEQMTTKYVGIQVARRPTPVAEKYLDYIVEHPLPNILIIRTYEEVLELFEGGSPAKQDTPPAQEPGKELPWNVPPTTQTPQLVQQHQQAPPVQTQQIQLCATTASFQGKSIGCGLQLGHAGVCDFTRMLGETTPPQTTTQSPTAPAPTPPPQMNTQVPPATSLPSRASSLRERFAKQ